MSRHVQVVWNVPNLLSLLRIFLIPPFIILFLMGGNYVYYSLIPLLLSGLSDSLDGVIARRYHMVTEFGKLLDPIADKLTQVAVVICMAIRVHRLIPLVVLMAIKESAQTIGGAILLRKGNPVHSAKWYGKLSTCLFYAAMASVLLFPAMPDAVFWVLLTVVSAAMLFSFVNYTREFCRQYRELTAAAQEKSFCEHK